jgi:hypothetical protein
MDVFNASALAAVITRRRVTGESAEETHENPKENMK